MILYRQMPPSASVRTQCDSSPRQASLIVTTSESGARVATLRNVDDIGFHGVGQQGFDDRDGLHDLVRPDFGTGIHISGGFGIFREYLTGRNARWESIAAHRRGSRRRARPGRPTPSFSASDRLTVPQPSKRDRTLEVAKEQVDGMLDLGLEFTDAGGEIASVVVVHGKTDARRGEPVLCRSGLPHSSRLMLRKSPRMRPQ